MRPSLTRRRSDLTSPEVVFSLSTVAIGLCLKDTNRQTFPQRGQAMLQLQQVKCPNCGSPADIDDSNCNYCFARISPAGESGSGSVVAGVMFAFVIGIFAADWYLGMGLTQWVVELGGAGE